ncbi:MAG: hypothetical protein Q4G26_01225 [Paracoccus sp. (in: a-proteobacteria)]|nr:hypothetical protein [Paracoccus sp. (in: a-proteobacteria)]
MKPHHITAAALGFWAVASLPLAAQDWQMPRNDSPPPTERQTPPPRNPGEDFGDALDQQLEGAMNQLFQRLQPHLNALGDELANTMNDFAPALNEISGLIDDIRNYEPPERLENGDILIRRRADAPPAPPLGELQRLLPFGEGRRTAPESPRLDPWRRPAPGAATPEPPPEQTEL